MSGRVSRSRLPLPHAAGRRFFTVETPTSVECEDYRDICGFCAEINQVSEYNLLWELFPEHDLGDFLLCETENFVVIPAVGAACDGYVLISPRAHVLSFAHLDPALDGELSDLLRRLGDHLLRLFGHRVWAFEHGAESFRNRGGSCTDHAHITMFPAKPGIDLVRAVGGHFVLHAVADHLPELSRQVLERRTSYFWIRAVDGRMWICDAPHTLSQFLRRAIFRDLGRPDEWDWAVFPQKAHVRATLGRFHETPMA